MALEQKDLERIDEIVMRYHNELSLYESGLCQKLLCRLDAIEAHLGSRIYELKDTINDHRLEIAGEFSELRDALREDL